ncbi:zonular occludens toxin domain-containing protein [Chitinimonas koreensis]|uniref:zonular occludens toxin domain-containing protein n=1 Tax=Chitinimonas koreensis TaxID=356302 RepID=UPI0016547000|nr:zonular occludens toxin domain-containing protein [Chitinimonas koreensis]QNM98681.1 hypothetical protein H9L41_10925 [Chitinimonas koreensis]
MFILITGLPGNGKTLFALKHIHERATKEERKVYYNGINLTDKGKEVLDWEHFEDPKRWFDFPPGAIVVLDEAQYLFEKRKSGERVPEFVAKVATHRHGGLDVYLITQRPSLIDPYVRDLVEKHYHVKRMFGGQRAMISEFSPASPNLSRADFKDAVQRPWPYPKEVYSWYVSAELHTHKLDLPWRKLAWGGGALLVGWRRWGCSRGAWLR